MQPPSLHSRFFSSLKQVEKRLKLENPSPEPQPNPTQTSFTSGESLSTPIYIHTEEEEEPSNNGESSVPPLAFLSCSSSLQSQPPHQNPLREASDSDLNRVGESKIDELDDVEQLMGLLGLSEMDKGGVFGGEGGGFCECEGEGGFYEKIVGVKGPKCRKEMERLEGWIKYFSGNGERQEPLRLAFLLLGKAASQGEDGGSSDGLEFPSTIDEFLKFDPPPSEVKVDVTSSVD